LVTVRAGVRRKKRESLKKGNRKKRGHLHHKDQQGAMGIENEKSKMSRFVQRTPAGNMEEVLSAYGQAS